MKLGQSPRKQARQELKLETESTVIGPKTPEPAVIADMSMLKAELIELAESMDISTAGTKAELVNRIMS